MAGELLYLDASALVKLVLSEAETASLREVLLEWPHRVTSQLAVVEVVRAARRASNSQVVHERAKGIVNAINLIQTTTVLLEKASTLKPRTLGSLDAVHLASALSLGVDLGAMAVYDRRLASAARKQKIVVLSP